MGIYTRGKEKKWMECLKSDLQEFRVKIEG